MPLKTDSTSSNSIEHKRLDDIQSNIIPTSSKLIGDSNRSSHQLTPNLRGQHLAPFQYFFLVFSLVSLALLWPVAASSLDLVAPTEVDVSGQGSYKMVFVSDTDSRDLSALVQIPEGFSYAGGSKAILDGRVSPSEPSQIDRSLRWELDAALKSCRSVVINEWEQNPEGADGGTEWIELYNPTSQAVDIGEWTLVDGYSGKSVTIPAGTSVTPDGYQVVTWSNGTLINSYLTCIALMDLAGNEVDRTADAKDEKNNNLCQARYPDGRDLGSDSDWRFQASSPGSSNGGSKADIYAGEPLVLSFNLTPGCGAPRQATLSGEIHSTEGTILAPSLPLNVGRANLSLSATPDRFDVAKGDVIEWTVILENYGNGTAYGVAFNATLGQGLELLSTETPWTGLIQENTTLAPGAEEQIRLKARVASSAGDYSGIFDVRWGKGPCQELNAISRLGARTAIRKQPDEARSLTIGEAAGYEIEADLPKGAQSLWINDTVPKGLIYNQSSLSLHGLSPQREVLTSNYDGSLQICRFFGEVGQAQTIEIAYNCRLENAPACQDGVRLAGGDASMSWTDGQALKTDSDEAGALMVAEPDLTLELQASRPFAAAEEQMSYLLSVYHSSKSHAPAYDIDLEDLLPEDLTYEPGSAEILSGPAASFDGQDPKWHFDFIDLDWDGSRKIVLRFNATNRASPGAETVNRARITWTSLSGSSPDERTGDGGLNDYLRLASSQVSAMGLSLQKTADPNPVNVGEPLSYTLAYENQGSKIAHNITICDDLDPGVTFLSADPAPAPSEDRARNIAWHIPELAPDGPHSIAIKVRVSETLADGEMLQNRFSIQCDELEQKSGTIFTPVQNETRLSVNKTALQKAVRRGEEVDYVIKICNRGGKPATNVTVQDVFDSSVELVSATPAPAGDGIWRFASLMPGECIQIGLTVRVPQTDVKYESHQTVKGVGFVRTYQDYTTSRTPSVISNRVYVTSDQMRLSATAAVSVLAEEGTSFSRREHGSGDYEDREDTRFLTANKSIKVDRTLRASYHPTALLLPENRTRSISSLWHEDARARNTITNTSFQESYRYSTDLDGDSHLDLDKNGSKMDISSNFRGLAHMRTQKIPLNSAVHKERAGTAFLAEDYIGAFLVSESFLDPGQGLIADRSVSGQGYVAKDAEVSDRQRSYEYGTGAYRSLERIETLSGFMAKDLDVSQSSLSYEVAPGTNVALSQKWSEGMWSRSPTSFIGESYSDASRLKKEARAAGLKELESRSSFSGRAEMRTVYGNDGRNRSLQADKDETLVGDFRVERKIIISRAGIYDEPHLDLRKDGRLIDDVASYTITITNNGNANLGPIFCRDIFPNGARFINSTLKPTRMDENSSNWTLLHLAIGDSIRIEINLNVKRCPGNIVNLASVVGNYSSGSVAAQNLSVIDRAWLGGCVPARESVPSGELSCACLETEESISCKDDYLDPLQAGSTDNVEGSCPLDCPAIEDAHSSILNSGSSSSRLFQ